MKEIQYFYILGDNSKCITNIDDSIKIDLQSNKCLKFFPNENNNLMINNNCLNKNFKIDNKDCLQTNYLNEEVINDNNICFNNSNGKPEKCYKTQDNYMRLSYRSNYA